VRGEPTPEGRPLDVVSTTHQVAKNNLYGLIRELGQETSGALSFLAGEATRARQTSRREIHNN
jgi:serine/threonine-protein kinase HipA